MPVPKLVELALKKVLDIGGSLEIDMEMTPPASLTAAQSRAILKMKTHLGIELKRKAAARVIEEWVIAKSFTGCNRIIRSIYRLGTVRHIKHGPWKTAGRDRHRIKFYWFGQVLGLTLDYHPRSFVYSRAMWMDQGFPHGPGIWKRTSGDGKLLDRVFDYQPTSMLQRMTKSLILAAPFLSASDQK